MMYKDLTQYEYNGYSLPECVNIGWLDVGYTFEKGNVPDEFIEKLKHLPIISQHLGSHICPFCGNDKSSNVRIVIGNGVYYMTPAMIAHYVEKHNYKPPQEFIEAVMNTEITDAEAKQHLNKTLKKYIGDLPFSKYMDTIRVNLYE